MVDLGYPTLDLPKVEVCISGEVLTDRGLDVTQSAVKGGATHTDYNCNQTKQEEEQAGVSTTNIYTKGSRETINELVNAWTCIFGVVYTKQG